MSAGSSLCPRGLVRELRTNRNQLGDDSIDRLRRSVSCVQVARRSLRSTGRRVPPRLRSDSPGSATTGGAALLKVAMHRVADGEADRLRSWMSELMRRRDEVIATFENEGVRHETG